MNENEIKFPIVTAIIRCDLYPGYVVTMGGLQMDGGIRLSSGGTYSGGSVLKVLPLDAYNTQEQLLRQIKNSYREQERQLRIDILKQHGVDFVTVN